MLLNVNLKAICFMKCKRNMRGCDSGATM